MRGECRAAPVSARVLAKDHMTLFVSVHIRDVVARVGAVSAFVYLVLPAVAIARFDPMVSPVLMPMVHIVADHLTAVQAYALFPQFAPHEWGVDASQFLLVMAVIEGFAVVVTSWYPPATVGAVNDLLVVTVLAHLFEHVGSFKLCMAYNAVVEFYPARHGIMRFSTLA